MSLSCIIIDDEAHAIGELSALIDANSNVELEKTFRNVPDSIEFLEDEGKVDVIFCDINMPDMDGLAAAELLHPFCRFLIFVTGYEEYALDAFGKYAVGYLLKPVDEEPFNERINMFITNDREFLADNIIEKQGEFFVKGGGKDELIRIDLDDIRYIKSAGNYCVIHFANSTKVITYGLLGDLEIRFKRFKQFFRVSKTTIISMRFFKKLDGNTIYLATGNKLSSESESFPVGTKYKAALLSFIKGRSLNF